MESSRQVNQAAGIGLKKSIKRRFESDLKQNLAWGWSNGISLTATHAIPFPCTDVSLPWPYSDMAICWLVLNYTDINLKLSILIIIFLYSIFWLFIALSLFLFSIFLSCFISLFFFRTLFYLCQLFFINVFLFQLNSQYNSRNLSHSSTNMHQFWHQIIKLQK